MNQFRVCLLLVVAIPSLVRADVAPAEMRVPEPTAWAGQRLTYFVDLHARGTFDGAASFSLPPVSRTVIVKIGNPVVSSKEIDGESWFVQTHEFALFSQQDGKWELPAFEVRFASRDGFTGPVSDQTATVPATGIEIRRPPGVDPNALLVTTESFDVSQTWEPEPGSAKVGAVFKRTISQHADNMIGIALPPPPTSVPEGFRLYLADPVVTDDTDRGNLNGERQDTVTYVLRQSGTLTLPAITYVWWNPATEKLMSKTLPAATFSVAATAAPPQAADVPRSRTAWILGIGAALLMGLGLWQRERLAGAGRRLWQKLNPPDRVAARQLLHACRTNDAAAASRAWLSWLSLQKSGFVPAEPLAAAAIDLERHRYGTSAGTAWNGNALQSAFSAQLHRVDRRRRTTNAADLPPLNA